MPPREVDCSQKTILFSQNSTINTMCQFFLHIVTRRHSMLCFCERIRKSVLFISLMSFNEHMGGITSRRFTLYNRSSTHWYRYMSNVSVCNYFLYSNRCARLKRALIFKLGEHATLPYVTLVFSQLPTWLGQAI